MSELRRKFWCGYHSTELMKADPYTYLEHWRKAVQQVESQGYVMILFKVPASPVTGVGQIGDVESIERMLRERYPNPPEPTPSMPPKNKIDRSDRKIFLLLATCVPVLFYLLGSFYSISFDLSKWSSDTRMYVAVGAGLSWLFIGILAIMITFPAPKKESESSSIDHNKN